MWHKLVMRLYLSIILLSILSISVVGQAKKTLQKSKPPTVETERAAKDMVVPSGKDFSIKAIVVYPSGEVLPIAYQTFYLLDDELLTILKNAGIEPTDATLQIYKGDADKALINDAGYSFAGRFQSPYTELAAKVSEAIKPHIVRKIKTDMQGRATFKGLGEENYYLFGTGGADYSNIIWNLRIDTAKQSIITLDQNNAASLN